MRTSKYLELGMHCTMFSDKTVQCYSIDQGILSVEWVVKDIVYTRLLFYLINRFALHGLTTMPLICSVLCQQWRALLSDVSKVW